MFRSIGIVMGMSLMQGGSGYPYFAPCIFDYLCGKDLAEIMVSREDIPDGDMLLALEKVGY